MGVLPVLKVGTLAPNLTTTWNHTFWCVSSSSWSRWMQPHTSHIRHKLLNGDGTFTYINVEWAWISQSERVSEGTPNHSMHSYDFIWHYFAFQRASVIDGSRGESWNCCAWCEFESFRKHGILLCPDLRGLLLKQLAALLHCLLGGRANKRCIREYLGREREKNTDGGMLGGEGSVQCSQSIGQRRGEWKERCRLSNSSFATLSLGNLTE